MNKSSKLFRILAVTAVITTLAVQVAYTTCCNKGAQGACNLADAAVNCAEGQACDTETNSTTSSTECGETGSEKTPYMVCIAGGKTECHQAVTSSSFGKIYYCYCLDDWGWEGTCTMNIVDTCYNYPYVGGC